MAFVSSILTDRENISTLSSNNISSIKEMTLGSDDSYIYSVLEFNEKLHCIDIEDKISYYRALVESINGNKSELEAIYESMIVDAIKRIIKVITTIIDWIKDKLTSIFEINTISQREFNMRKKSSKSFTKNVNLEKEYTFTCFNYPMFNRIDSRICDNALKEIFENIEDICNGKDLPEASETTLKLAYSKLAKSIEDDVRSSATSEIRTNYTGPREDREGFVKFISNNIIFRDRKHMPYYRWKDMYIDTVVDISKTAIDDKMRYITDKLQDTKERVSRIETLDQLQRSNLSTYIAQANAIVRSYEWFLYSVINMRRSHMREIIRVYNNIIRNDEDINESGIIHGEPFNSDTLFDNDDYRDFNRTEWIDLKLEAELYSMSHNLAEGYKEAALKEALILTENNSQSTKYVQLHELNAETWQKAKLAVEVAIRNIIKFLDKAIAIVIDKINPSTLYVKANENQIRGNIFAIKATSKIDLFNGIGRIKEDIRPVPYDYNKLKDDLESVNTFFKKHILPELERSSIRMHNDIKYNDQMGINKYMHMYYGLSNGDSQQDIEFGAAMLEKNKSMMIDYILSPNRLFATLRSDLSQLEINAKKASSAISKPAEPSAQNTEVDNKTSNENIDTANHEAVYSYLYNSWLTEADINNGSIPTANSVETGVSKDTAIRNYISAYKLVYTAKINAARSIISEFGGIMKAHVEHYSPKKKQNGNVQQNTVSTNTAAQNQAQPNT